MYTQYCSVCIIKMSVNVHFVPIRQNLLSAKYTLYMVAVSVTQIMLYNTKA